MQKALKDVHIAKARAADIEAVTAQVGSTTSIFISGPPLHGEGWTATSEGSVYGTYRGTEEVRTLINEEVIDRRFWCGLHAVFKDLVTYTDNDVQDAEVRAKNEEIDTALTALQPLIADPEIARLIEKKQIRLR